MNDRFGREIKYLRISVTDRCNLRCKYCMPASGVELKKHEQMLTEEEMITAVSILTDMGVKKVRITGGEPLIKKNILSILEKIRKIQEVETLAITTNGVLLGEKADALRQIGVNSINISLDTLNEKKYSDITRGGNLQNVISSIKKALSLDFDKVKINSVLIGGFNDDEIEDLAKLTMKYPLDVRFIELMPMPEIYDFGEKAYLPADMILKKINGLEELPQRPGDTAKLFRLKNSLGKIGIISPVTGCFCDSCNRIRITSDGYVKPCLHSKDEYIIKGLSPSEMRAKFIEALNSKNEKHAPLSYCSRSHSQKTMNQIGG